MLDKLKDKYVFFDVDGTLSEYRFKGQLYGGKCPELGCQLPRRKQRSLNRNHSFET